MTLRVGQRWVVAGFALLLACSAESSGEPGTADPQATNDGGASGSPEVGSGDDPATEPTGTTWHRDVRPILERHCLQCHVDGGIGPFALTSFDAAAGLAALIGDAVQSGRMPPWLPDPQCHPTKHARVLSPAEVETIRQWATDPIEGDEAEYVAPSLPPQASLGPPDRTMDAGGGYTPKLTLTDDYRCLPLDHVFAEETFVTAIRVNPDQKAIVHHVILSLVEPSEVPKLATLSAQEPDQLGYTCFGGPQVSSTMIGGWVPGSPPFVLPEGSAFQVPKGSQIVAQIHYYTTPLGQESVSDRTSLDLWTLPGSETPTQLARIAPLAHPGLFVPAGDSNSVQTNEFTVPIPARIVGVLPHMHLLGKSLRVELERADGGESECLVDVPRWDFQWQQFYLYEDDAAVFARVGDTLRLTCAYDNSPPNQPVVAGQQLEPRDVRWGEGTLDEMCLNYLLTTVGYDGEGGGACPGVVPCTNGCTQGDGGCYLQCLVLDGAECSQCMVQATAECAKDHCLLQLGIVGNCLNGCDQGLQSCLLGECLDEVDALYGCLEEPLKSGGCDVDLDACGVAFQP